MEIVADTRINVILKHDPEALDAIVSISPKFEKLRNPVLRKLMAGRTSIAMASRIAGCAPAVFFDKLRPLGFTHGAEDAEGKSPASKAVPGFIQELHRLRIMILDVRPTLDSGEDPLRQIQTCVSSLKTGEVLKIVNRFEPAPLISLLGKQGFESYSQQTGPGLVETYFHRSGKIVVPLTDGKEEDDWDEIRTRFRHSLHTIDVRQMEMPLPMVTILEELEKLPAGTALHVHHKRIPILLFPQLTERNFSYRLKRISGTEVDLLIFKQ